jgi:hypothetical protein
MSLQLQSLAYKVQNLRYALLDVPLVQTTLEYATGNYNMHRSLLLTYAGCSASLRLKVMADAGEEMMCWNVTTGCSRFAAVLAL